MVMHKMMYINDAKHLCERDGVCYFVRRVPVDVLPYHSSNRISISLKTKSASAAVRASKSIYHSNSYDGINQTRHHYTTHTSPDSIIMHRLSEMALEIGVEFAS